MKLIPTRAAEGPGPQTDPRNGVRASVAEARHTLSPQLFTVSLAFLKSRKSPAATLSRLTAWAGPGLPLRAARGAAGCSPGPSPAWAPWEDPAPCPPGGLAGGVAARRASGAHATRVQVHSTGGRAVAGGLLLRHMGRASRGAEHPGRPVSWPQRPWPFSCQTPEAVVRASLRGRGRLRPRGPWVCGAFSAFLGVFVPRGSVCKAPATGRVSRGGHTKWGALPDSFLPLVLPAVGGARPLCGNPPTARGPTGGLR